MPAGTASSRVRLGVVGCGSIAQMMHLPNAQERRDAEVVALCDPATDVLDAVGDRFGVDGRYESVEAFLDREADSLDGVLVCTPSHTRLTTALPVLERGVPALVEKPLAATPEDADTVAAAARSGPVAMVGYMKRYHPTVQEAIRTIDDRDAVDHVEMYDVAPDHGRIVRELHSTIGEPPGEMTPARAERMAEAIGSDADRLVEAYSFQLEHACHDVNLLRAAFGEVTDVDHVAVFNEGRYLGATLRYGDVRCSLTTGISERKWFEERLRVDTPRSRVRLEFDNPYKRDAPPSLEVVSGDEAYERTVTRRSYRDSFALELDHFIACIRGDATPRTPLDEAAADVAVLAELFRTCAADDPAA